MSAKGAALLNLENKNLVICQPWFCAAPSVLIFDHPYIPT